MKKAKGKKERKRISKMAALDLEDENNRQREEKIRKTVHRTPYQDDNKDVDNLPKRNFRKNGGLPKKQWKHDRR